MNIAEAAVNSAVRRIEELEKQLATNEVFKVGYCGGFRGAIVGGHCGAFMGL